MDDIGPQAAPSLPPLSAFFFSPPPFQRNEQKRRGATVSRSPPLSLPSFLPHQNGRIIDRIVAGDPGERGLSPSPSFFLLDPQTGSAP